MSTTIHTRMENIRSHCLQLPARFRMQGTFLAAVAFAIALQASSAAAGHAYHGHYFSGTGDTAYVTMLDIARSMHDTTPLLQSVPQLYYPPWNSLVEGPTVGASTVRVGWPAPSERSTGCGTCQCAQSMDHRVMRNYRLLRESPASACIALFASLPTISAL